MGWRGADRQKLRQRQTDRTNERTSKIANRQ